MIAGFAPEAVALAFAACLAAGFVRGLAGFGLAVLLVPVLALAVTPARAVTIATALGLLSGLLDLRQSRRDGEPSVRAIALLAIVATPGGVWALAVVPSEIARLLIAMVAIGAFVIVLLPQRAPHAPGRVETAGTGIAAGLLTGFAGMPGPPVVSYYLGRAIPPVVARASMMQVFLATSAAGMVSLVVAGLGGWREIVLACGLFPAVLAGNWLGEKAFGRIGAGTWRAFVGIVLATAAAGAVVRLL